jgi:hypothetical protein
MEQRENHFLETDAKVAKTRWFFGLLTFVGLGVRTEQAAENALDFDPGGMHANRFQRRV